jgi:hypothetical protein
VRTVAVVFDPLLHWMSEWQRLKLLTMATIYVASASLLAVILMAIVEALSMSLSRLASWLLNPVAAQQIKATGFGSDATVDAAVGATDFPMWLGHGRPPLPAGVAAAVEELSDRAAAGAISKLRSAIKDLSLARGDTELSDKLSQYLTWEELVHTSYFSVLQFKKLVAYAVSRQKGFRANAAFMQDPDFELVAQWYCDIAGGTGGAPSIQGEELRHPGMKRVASAGAAL